MMKVPPTSSLVGGGLFHQFVLPLIICLVVYPIYSVYTTGLPFDMYNLASRGSLMSILFILLDSFTSVLFGGDGSGDSEGQAMFKKYDNRRGSRRSSLEEGSSAALRNLFNFMGTIAISILLYIMPTSLDALYLRLVSMSGPVYMIYECLIILRFILLLNRISMDHLGWNGFRTYVISSSLAAYAAALYLFFEAWYRNPKPNNYMDIGVYVVYGLSLVLFLVFTIAIEDGILSDSAFISLFLAFVVFATVFPASKGHVAGSIVFIFLTLVGMCVRREKDEDEDESSNETGILSLVQSITVVKVLFTVMLTYAGLLIDGYVSINSIKMWRSVELLLAIALYSLRLLLNRPI